MQPQLIEKKVLKKLLRKAYKQTDNDYMYDKMLKNLKTIIVNNWFIFLIIIFLIIIFIHLYKDNLEKKKTERMKQEEDLIKAEIELNKEPEYFTDSYQSEYYKMLPKVINQPEIIPYRY
jgi:hypothetical protein